MTKTFFRMTSFALLLALTLAAIPLASAYAADIISIAPNSILNNAGATITVTGSGFDNTAVVSLNSTALSTTFVDAQTLTAIVPAGVAPGAYQITVSLSGGSANGFAVLTVNAPPTSTPAPLPFVRPQIVVNSTKVTGNVVGGGNFNLRVSLNNSGTSTAYNAQAVFTSVELVPTKTGGVVALGLIDQGADVGMNQSFYVPAGVLAGKSLIVVDLSVTYYDYAGTAYTDKFTLSVPITGGGGGGGAAAATATPTGVKSSQLVITGYSASVDPLQPGGQFDLKIKVQNVGNLKAQRVTMIVGGGSSGGSGGGTPQPGGVSGGSGDFANFAPVGASNVQSLGELAPGGTIEATQSLIVNVNTVPGAYPMRISFSYLNDKNDVVNDDQVITLLVYSLPNVDVSFYRPPDPFFAGQPGALPIQVVNLGKRLSVLGDIKLSAQSGFIENGSSLVGPLDAGGFFTLDAMFTPDQSGPQVIDVTINYLDDFNQPRTITKTLEIEVQEGFIEPTPDPSINGGGGGGGGEFPIPTEETTLQKVWRFILGLFGLDSSTPSNNGGASEVPVPEGPSGPVVVPSGGKGG